MVNQCSRLCGAPEWLLCINLRFNPVAMNEPTPAVRMAAAADAVLIASLSRLTFYESFAADNTAENMEKFMNGPFAEPVLQAELNGPR